MENIFTSTLFTISKVYLASLLFKKYNYIYKFYKDYTKFDVIMNDISEWNTHMFENYMMYI